MCVCVCAGTVERLCYNIPWCFYMIFSLSSTLWPSVQMVLCANHSGGACFTPDAESFSRGRFASRYNGFSHTAWMEHVSLNRTFRRWNPIPDDQRFFSSMVSLLIVQTPIWASTPLPASWGLSVYKRHHSSHAENEATLSLLLWLAWRACQIYTGCVRKEFCIVPCE